MEEHKNKTATPFQMVKFRTGHFSANYSKWLTKETQNIEHYTTHYQLYGEPCVIVRKDVYLPRYDGRFNEYGFNKIVYFKGLGVVDEHNFNAFMVDLYLSSLHTTSKDFLLKVVEIKMQGKEERTKHGGSSVQTSDEWLFGCECLCFAIIFVSGSRQIYHIW